MEFTKILDISLIIFLFLIFFITLWLGISWLTSRISGWTYLSNIYPGDKNIDGKKFKFVFGRVGWINYNGILVIYVSKKGLQLSINPFFKFKHPDLLIPWNRINELGNQKIWFFSSYTLEILGNKGESISRLEIPENIFEEIKDFINHT